MHLHAILTVKYDRVRDRFEEMDFHIEWLKLADLNLGSIYTGPVGTVPYGTDWYCLELIPL